MLNIEIPNLARIRAKLHPSLILTPAQTVIRDAASFTVRQAAADAPRDIGAVARSLVADVHGLQAKVRSTLPGALAIEYGRHPGRKLPPDAEIRAWAERHGLAGMEFVIARAIARRGIKGRFFLRRAVQALRDRELPRLLAAARHEIETRWAL